MQSSETVIRQFYDYFNKRQLDAAARLFSVDAVLEHAATKRHQRGGEGYLEFAHMWTRAFPDAAIQIERIASRDGVTHEVDLRAAGTHLGALDMGTAGIFQPTGVKASLRMRQLLEIRDGRIRFSSLSFDVQDIVHQLVTVDTAKLLEHIQRIQQLAAKLAGTPESDVVERRNLVNRLGTELDLARYVVRPYFSK